MRMREKFLAGVAALGVLALLTSELVAQHPITQNLRRRMPRQPSVPPAVSNPLNPGADPPGFDPNQVFGRFPTNAPQDGSVDVPGGGGGGVGTLNAVNVGSNNSPFRSAGNQNLLLNRNTVIQPGFTRGAIIQNNFGSNPIMQRNAIIQNGIRRNAIIRNNFRRVPIAPAVRR